jgi:hypothetical protein
MVVVGWLYPRRSGYWFASLGSLILVIKEGRLRSLVVVWSGGRNGEFDGVIRARR